MTDNKVLNEEDLEKASGGANENPNFNESEISFTRSYHNYNNDMFCPHCNWDGLDFDSNTGASIFKCKRCGWIDWSSAFFR